MSQPHRSIWPPREGELAVITYHYVRGAGPSSASDVASGVTDGTASPFESLHCRSLDEFSAQLEVLRRSTRVLHPEELSQWASGALAGEPCSLLTFDDGYCEHARSVAPRLEAAGLRGIFFLPVQAVRDRIALDVNRIQLLTANVPSSVLLQTLRSWARSRGASWTSTLEAAIADAVPRDRFDDLNVALIKNLLQRDLPREFRQSAIAALAERLLPLSDGEMVDALYMRCEEAAELTARGHAVGGHSATHPWLPRLSAETQAAETLDSARFLRELGVEPTFFSYPYGSCDAVTVECVRAAGFRFAFTVEPRCASADGDPLRTPRLDTNDVPVAPEDLQ